MYTDRLYVNDLYPDTESCYLDGRYFNKVFAKYPGLITEPLVISIKPDKISGETTYTNYMKEFHINNNYPGLLRVIIETPTSRHSNLLIIDYHGGKIFRFDPNGISSPYYQELNKIIERYMYQYIDFDIVDIDSNINQVKNPYCVQKGVKSGFCLAYVIKFGYDYLNNMDFNANDILKFSKVVESKYGPLPESDKDIEYGFLGIGDNPDKPNQGRNVVVGALGGALLGGAIGGGGGALMGGLGGGLIGGII